MSHVAQGDYYVPHGTRWPIVGSVGLWLLFIGFTLLLNEITGGGLLMLFGFVVVLIMMYGWFGEVIRESEAGTYSDQVDRSFRWGMSWFIFSEVMFFAAFFGALYYARQFSVPWLAGAGGEAMTNALLWQGYTSDWPTNGPGAVGGAFDIIGAWGVPAINTAILLTSGLTVTIAHWGLKEGKRTKLIWGLAATVALGATFIVLQAFEYIHAYHELNLTLHSGIYGSTFFMLTGFHGLHVTIGAIMLTVILLRSIKGHFTAERHFAFEAVAWYWHFVDVVWLGLFIFVYIL